MIALLFIVAVSKDTWAASYYLNYTNGNDSNTGISALQAWKTLSFLENYAQINPGDIIYFKRGESWDRNFRPTSGIGEKYVFYKAYGVGPKPVIRNCSVGGKSFISIEDIQFGGTDTNTPVYITGSNYISLKKCDIIAGKECTSYSALKITMNSSHNEIVACNIEHRNINSQNDAICLTKNSSYNLIKECNIKNATHYSISIAGNDDVCLSCNSNYNVIQNNIIENNEGAMVSMLSGANYNLFENNIVMGGKSTIFCNNSAHSVSVRSSHNVIRNNIICNNFASGSAFGIALYVHKYENYPPHMAIGNHIYKNIINNVRKNGIILGNYHPGISKCSNNIFKNNIISNNDFENGYQILITNDDDIVNNLFEENRIYSPKHKNIISYKGNAYSISSIESINPDTWKENNYIIPTSLQDSNNYPPALLDLFLINGEISLTKVTSPSGSGNTIMVEDASYFVDGFGIVDADTIKVNNIISSIQSVDYKNNIIILKTSLSWNNTDPVYLVAKPVTLLPSPENLRVRISTLELGL